MSDEVLGQESISEPQFKPADHPLDKCHICGGKAVGVKMISVLGYFPMCNECAYADGIEDIHDLELETWVLNKDITEVMRGNIIR